MSNKHLEGEKMVSNELKNIAKTLEKQGKMHFLDGATVEQIAQFEKDNSIQLPSKYKDWLLYSDGGEFFLPAGIQMYGVANKPLIDVMDEDRPNDNYIVIGALAFGDPILFQKNAETISIYNHEAGTIEDDEVYEDFIAFLNDLPNVLGIGV